MDFKILDYQKKDAEIIKLEKQLNFSEDKKVYTQMVAVVKDAQSKSAQLEQQAGELIENYKKLKQTYEDNLKSANIIIGKNLETAQKADLETIENISQNIINNLSILEKKLLTQAERVNAILVEFEQTKKRYNLAKEKYAKHKALYDEESKKVNPELEEKISQIKKLEPSIDPSVLAKYKQKRQDQIFPVFVPMLDKACGGCRMELPSASLSILKQSGTLECEHCRRIIYSQE